MYKIHVPSSKPHQASAMLLSAAALGDYPTALTALKKHGADINAQTDSDDTCLHLAILGGEEDSNLLNLIPMLLNQPNVNITIKASDGHTPRSLAAFLDFQKIVKLFDDKKPYDEYKEDTRNVYALKQHNNHKYWHVLRNKVMTAWLVMDVPGKPLLLRKGDFMKELIATIHQRDALSHEIRQLLEG